MPCSCSTYRCTNRGASDISTVFQGLRKPVFRCLLLHGLKHDLRQMIWHSSQLCRTIAEKYFDVKLFNHEKFYTESVTQKGHTG